MINYNPIHYFSIGSFKIHYYGLMLAIALIVCSVLASRKAKSFGLDGKKVFDSLVYIVVGALIGARLLYVAAYPYQFANFLEMLYIWKGGLVSHGGFIGGFLGFALFSKIYKLNFWKYADLIAPYVVLGMAITRIGCFLNWDDYGIYTDLPWGVSVGGDMPRHPTQIYHIITNLFIFLFLVKKRKEIKFSGQIFSLLLILYPILRFGVDFFRDYDYKIWVLAPSQWLMVMFLVLGIAVYWKRSKHGSREVHKRKKVR